MDGVHAPQEAVHAAMDVQLAPHEVLPAPLAVAGNVHAVEEAVDYIFHWIAVAQDYEALNTIWIRSAQPYQIEISLRVIKESICLFGQIHPDCFDLAVRKLASAEMESTAGTQMFGMKHYFDLQFHSQARSLRHSWMEQGPRTTTLVDNAVVRPFPKYDVFNSSIHLLPFSSVDSSYGLLVVNMESERFVHFDPSVDAYGHGFNFHSTEFMKEITMLKQEFNNVLQMRIPDWNTQLMDWPNDSICINGRRKDSAFQVLQEMAHQTGTYRSMRCKTNDSIQLRKQLMVQMLTIKDNEAAGNIPVEIRVALRIITD